MLSRILMQLPEPLVCLAKIPTLSLNECYHLRQKLGEREFFLKILSPMRAVEERLQELRVQQLASHAGLSPTLISSHHDAESTWLLLEFCLPSSPSYSAMPFPHGRKSIRSVIMDPRLQGGDTEDQISCLQEQLLLLKKFHHLPRQGLAQANPLLLAQHYLRAAQALAPKQPALRQLAQRLQTLSLPTFVEQRLCHFDVHPHNFLVTDEKLFLLDFENAGVFDPLYDVAVLSFYTGTQLAQLSLMLNIYDPMAKAEDLQRCQTYQEIILVLFLTYLAYHLLWQQQDFLMLAVNPHEAKVQFHSLIKSYYVSKNTSAQIALEQTLLALGLALLT